MSDFSLHSLAHALAAGPPVKRYWVAFSGGADSTALLHALSRSRPVGAALGVVHVHHGLQAQADSWARHCERISAQFGLSCRVLRVRVVRQGTESVEAAARRVRYEALEGMVADGDMLLAAHHREDQAETVLLQLFRGAGPRGLAAMPHWRPFGQGWIGRPLLDMSRDSIHAYVVRQRLQWVEDGSNRDVAHRRNFLRHEVLPPLQKPWPALAKVLGRVARHQAEAAELLADYASADLAEMGSADPDSLCCEALRRLPELRRANVLRHWLQAGGFAVPSSAQLNEIWHGLLAAGVDRMPLVSWPGVELRRYRGRLYAMVPRSSPPAAGVRLVWRPDEVLRLPHGTLRARQTRGKGLRLSESAMLEVRFRQGGERCCPDGRTHGQRLKKLFQEAGIPPWERSRIPLIYSGGELAAVAGLWVCAPFAVAGGEPGWIFQWCEKQLPED